METVRAKLEILKTLCEKLGRDYNEIEKTTLGTAYIAGRPDRPCQMWSAQCRLLAEVGVQHAIFNMPNVSEIKPLEIFGQEIIPEVAEILRISMKHG